MSVLAQQRCLVLNKGWAPISTVPLRRAIIMLFTKHEDGVPKARIIEPDSYQVMTWDDWSKLRPKATDETIQAGNIAFRVPEVILLSRYDKLPRPKIHFSRRNLYKRDEYTCQYCGCQPGSSELTIDHVLPKAQGGKSTWENCVLACIGCNSRKADRTPQQAHMKLAKEPHKPHLNMFKLDGMTKPIKSWEQFLGEAYWSVELKD